MEDRCGAELHDSDVGGAIEGAIAVALDVVHQRRHVPVGAGQVSLREPTEDTLAVCRCCRRCRACRLSGSSPTL